MVDDGPSARPAITVITSDEQSYTTIDSALWADLAKVVLKDEGVTGPVEVGLAFVESEAIAELHSEHLGGEGPTDVLSFPLDDDGSRVPSGQQRLLGDVVVCPEVAAAQAANAGHSLDHEIAVLVVHGVLHLLGYDHAEAAQEAAMFARQAELVQAHHRS